MCKVRKPLKLHNFATVCNVGTNFFWCLKNCFSLLRLTCDFSLQIDTILLPYLCPNTDPVVALLLKSILLSNACRSEEA